MTSSEHNTSHMMPSSASKRGLYRLVPSSFYGRSLMILIIPMILMQILAMYMFYERHWASVTRNMSLSLANDLALVVGELRGADQLQKDSWVAKAARILGIQVTLQPLPSVFVADTYETSLYPYLFQHLREQVGLPFTVRVLEREEALVISIKLRHSLLVAKMSRKRLTSPTTYIFTLWSFVTMLLVLAIATLFLRNQIRPIKRLAEAAEAFGTGRDDPNFSPRGAIEIRQAGHAFLRMRARLQRQIQTRTAMLSGISHDLRTPLTRMKLQLAMLQDTKAAKMLDADIQTMQHMIQEYLDYARGFGIEESQHHDVVAVVDEIIHRYQVARTPVEWLQVPAQPITLSVRKVSLQRALDNLIVNALRYGSRCRIAIEDTGSHVFIMVEDDGPGIAEIDHEAVFAPFRRLEVSRNIATGGVGLGLTIARDVVQGHGGDVILNNRLDESGAVLGLTAIIKLPRK